MLSLTSQPIETNLNHLNKKPKTKTKTIQYISYTRTFSNLLNKLIWFELCNKKGKKQRTLMLTPILFLIVRYSYFCRVYIACAGIVPRNNFFKKIPFWLWLLFGSHNKLIESVFDLDWCLFGTETTCSLLGK